MSFSSGKAFRLTVRWRPLLRNRSRASSAGWDRSRGVSSSQQLHLPSNATDPSVIPFGRDLANGQAFSPNPFRAARKYSGSILRKFGLTSLSMTLH